MPRLHLLAGLVFFALTLAMTWPLMIRLDTHITSGHQSALTVPYFNLWTLARNHRWLSDPTLDFWNANIFYPHQQTVAYSEPQLATSLLTFPLVLFGGNTILAYNVALLVFFSGAAMTAYALCWWLLGTLEEPHQACCARWWASVTAGIFYGFHFYLFREIEALQILATFFCP